VIDPEPLPDHLAGAVLRTLKRRRLLGPAPGLLLGGAAAFLTFGLFPILTWQSKFRKVVKRERTQFEHLLQWLATRGLAISDELERSVHVMRPTKLPLVISILVMILQMSMWNSQFGQIGIERMFQRVYSLWGATGHPQLYWTNALGLIWIAYVVHWLSVRIYWMRVRRFMSLFNRELQRLGVRPVVMPRMGLGLRPVWTLAGLAFLVAGAPWGLVVMLAGGQQRRYTTGVGPAVADQLAEGMQRLIAVKYPGTMMPRMVSQDRRCGNSLCRAAFPVDARFCSRCGQPVAG
jgi:hypothetical protein